MRKMLICLTALILCSGATCIVPAPAPPSIGEYSHGVCVDGQSEQGTDDYPGCGDDQIVLTVEGNTIRMAHHNSTYNCCLDDVTLSLTVEGTEITLTETEVVPNPCDCLCCYTVNATIINVPSGAYTVIVCWQDYETGQTECYTEDITVP